MTRAQVVAAVGKPDDERVNRRHIAGPVRTLLFGTQTGLTRVELYATGMNPVVFLVTSSDTAERTKRGVGVGSRERIVRRRVADARCRTRFGRRSCLVGRLEPGRLATDFFISKGTRRVTRVTIGIMID